MDVIEAIRTRRSIGRPEGDVSRDDVRALVELATWAPNHRLTEPWRFTVVAGDARESLAALWGRIVADGTGAQGDARTEAIKRAAEKVLRAPLLVVVSTRTDDDLVVAEEDLAATAAAVQNMLLAAWARGFGAMWRTGAMVRHPDIKAFLGLEPSDRIVAVVYLGRAAPNSPPPRARNVDAVFRWLEVRP
jgi:nitroreductase